MQSFGYERSLPLSTKSLKLITFGINSLIITIIALIIAFGLYIPYLKTYTMLHPARFPFKRTPADVGIAHYEEITFTTFDGLTLKGWYIPPQNGAVVIFVHGLGADRLDMLNEAGLLVANGYGALLFDMRAHGKSGGDISTVGYKERRDIHSAVNFVRLKAGKNAPLALFAHSMGTGAALMAAAEIPEISAVIVESAFTSIEENIGDVTQSLTGLPPFIFAPLIVFYGQQQTGVDISAIRPVDIIGQISPRAVLLIQGENDTTIPVRNAYRLYAAAKEPKQIYILPGVGHGGFLRAEPTIFKKTVLTFLKTYLK